MMNPRRLLQENLTEPVARFYRNFLSRDAISKGLQKTSNFIYDRSSDPSFMMIFFTSFSIISSHLAQLNGLRKSKRENKDYLMQQEKVELGLDIALSVLPTFALNRFLSKKFDSGAWATESSRHKLVREISKVIGADNNDLYDTSHIVPIKEKIVDGYNAFKGFLARNKHIPEAIQEKINFKPINKNKVTPAPKFVSLLLEYDDIKKGTSKVMRNGKAMDDLGNSRNGMLVMATLGYTILATNVIMPILKNLLTNRTYKKELAEKGETPESIRRKKRYTFNTNPVLYTNSNEFSALSSINNTSKDSLYHQNLKNISQYNNVNAQRTVFKDITPKTSSLKI